MHHLPKELYLLLAASIIALILRFLQKRFPKSDPLFVERLIIAICAGLLLLIAINKLLGDPGWAPLSIPFAIATFVVSIFHPGYGLVKALPHYRVIFPFAVFAVALACGTRFGLPGILVVIPTLFLFPTL
jgi:hypothetical protein